MRSFQALGSYFSAAKEKVTSTALSIWKYDYVQATWQGLTAPIYSYTSWRGMVDSSDDVETSVSRAFKLNATYALHALVSYFVYYRMVQPGMNAAYADQDPQSWTGATAQLGIATTDTVLCGLINVYLVSLWLQNTVQNFALTSSITYTAGLAMRPSDDFKPCDCSKTQIARADGDSLIYYTGNRYVVTKLSQSIASGVPGWSGKALAFGLEAASFGWPLVEYKYSAVGKCTEHRYKDMLTSYKTYCFMYGASFVASTWASYKILAAVSGEENPYIYDAVFSFMFQMYALLAISREKKFPGNDHVTIDIVAWFNYVSETRGAQYLLKKFLGDLYSLEKMVQSPGVALLLSVRDHEIKDGISSLRGGIQQVREIQSSRLVSTAKWVSHLLPYNVIPEELKMVCKSFSKTAISKLIRKTERLLELARNAEVQRSAQPRQLIVDTVEDHFVVPGVVIQELTSTSDSEQKSQVVSRPLELKPDGPIEKKQLAVLPPPDNRALERNLDTVLKSKNIVVDGDYFVEAKASKLERAPSQHLFLQTSPLFFVKKENDIFNKSFQGQGVPQKQESLASMTVSIISGVGKSKALK